MCEAEHRSDRLASDLPRRTRRHLRCLERWQQDHIERVDEEIYRLPVQFVDEIAELRLHPIGRLAHSTAAPSRYAVGFALGIEARQQVIKVLGEADQAGKVTIADVPAPIRSIERQEVANAGVDRHDAPLVLGPLHRDSFRHTQKPTPMLKDEAAIARRLGQRLTPSQALAGNGVIEPVLGDSAFWNESALLGILASAEMYFLKPTGFSELALGGRDRLAGVANGDALDLVRNRVRPLR